MLRATMVSSAGVWSAPTTDTIVLDYDERHRRRVAMPGVRGLAFLLDRPETKVLHNGDALRLEDGRLVEVVAAPEALAEIPCPELRTPVRIAWHLGNRHLPVEIAGSKLRIRRNHVIEAMVWGLGGTIVAIEARFDPDGGAHTSDAGHGHDRPH